MENSQKRLRARKTTSGQVEFLISYMENHKTFATGKLLGARRKAAHDTQWQILTEKLNDLNGPSKPIGAWKKLWYEKQCRTRAKNQCRARAAKGKAQLKLTGNVGKPIKLKDLDLRILSIIGGESSVGLPITEVGIGNQFEDTMDPSLILGLTNDTVKEKLVPDDAVSHKEKNVIIENEKNIYEVVMDDSILPDNFSSEDFFQSNYQSDSSTDIINSKQYINKASTNKRPRNSFLEKTNYYKNTQVSPEPNCRTDTLTDIIIPSQYINKTSTSDECTDFTITTPQKIVSKQLGTKTSKSDVFNYKRPRNSFLEKTNYKNTQVFPQPNCQTDTLTDITIPSQYINKASTSDECTDFTITTPQKTVSKQLGMKTSKSDGYNIMDKRSNSSLGKTLDYFKNTQDEQNKSAQAMVENLNRIASAVEEQNDLIRRSLALHENTLKILSRTVKDLSTKI